MANTPFPVIMLMNGAQIPETGSCYLIGKEGVYLRKDTGLFSATVKVSEISFLEPVEQSFDLRLPPLPMELTARTYLFFRRVCRRSASEAIVLIHYRREDGTYLLSCPEQEVSPGAIRFYDATERIPGYQLVGTIHSHGHGGAYHSSTDHADEIDFDGLHITLGNVGMPYFSLSCSFMVNGNRFHIPPEEIMDGIEKTNLEDVIPFIEKHKRARKRAVRSKQHDKNKEGAKGATPQSSHATIAGEQEHIEPYIRMLSIGGSKAYKIILPQGKDFRNIGVPTNWFGRVRESYGILALCDTQSMQL